MNISLLLVPYSQILDDQGMSSINFTHVNDAVTIGFQLRYINIVRTRIDNFPTDIGA